MTVTSVSGVDHLDTGVASALLNTAQQIGGGCTLAFVAAGAMFLAGLAITILAVNAGKQQHIEGGVPVHMG